MNAEFHLSNDGAPAFQKPDPEAFLPMTTLQKARQDIYRHLQSNRKPTKLSEIAAAVKSPLEKCRTAARLLARKRIIRAKPIVEPAPTVNRPERTVKSLEIEFIEPWSEKIKPVEL